MKAVIFLVSLAACSSLASAQGFKQVYPSYPIPHVSALVHWNGDTVFASGTNSVFMRSTDAGLTWTDVFSNDTHYDFPRMGANASGIFLLPAYTYYTKHEFLDSTSTFIIHYNPVTGDTHRVIIPVLCHPRRPTELPREISVTSDAVFMLQNTKASEVGNMALLRSLDNGATWHRLPLPDAVVKYNANMSFRDANYGILASPPPDSVHVQAVYITTNAGSTWERVYGFYHPRNPLYSAMQCVDDSTIVIKGDDENLHVTKDRGAHWCVSTPASFIISTFHFLPDGSGYISGGDGQVARTTDFGATWIHIKTGDNPGKAGFSGQMSVLALRSDQFLFSDISGATFRTTDAGQTWDFAFSQDVLLPKSFRFFSRNDGVMESYTKSFTSSRRDFYGTSDGGITWDLLFDATAIGIGLGNVYPATSREFWAVSSSGINSDTLVYHTSNKGAAWDASFIRSPDDTSHVDFYARGNFTCGADSMCILLNTGVLRTTNKGTSWSIHPQALSLFANRSYRDERIIYASSSKHIWLSTPNRILRSDNYGQTWIVAASLDSASSDAFSELKAVSDSLVYVMNLIP